jgi:hypothetical protein
LAGAWILGVAAIGIHTYAGAIDVAYPIRLWLFWKLGMLWGWALLFNVACLSFGQLVLVRGLKMVRLPALESAVLSMAIGVVGFVLAMYVGGALAWFTPVFAVSLPLVLLAVSAGDGAQLVRRLIAGAGIAAPRNPFVFVITAAGVVCVFVVYLGAMTPDALNYDSTWCHLTVAQDYARAGRIIPFPADYTKNVPQLASVIHTWGWLLPGLDPPLRWMMALHDEFSLFLWTLAGIAAAVRRLTGDQSLRGTWVAFFLFPIVFVYDNNLGGAADHICAFFAPPLLLATLRVSASFSRGNSALLGIVCAGAIATKYQALYEIIGAAGVVFGFWIYQLFQHRMTESSSAYALVPLRELLWSPAIVAGFAVLCASPHFIRQSVFHHNPVYPFMQGFFTRSTPTLPNADFLFKQTITDPRWRPQGTLWEKFVHGCKLFVQFSFEPHYSFTRNVPAFGSLFTLLSPALIVVRNSRLLIATVIASGALLLWGMLYNVDRNLQIFMPLFVCVTAALIVLIWRIGILARVGLIPLLLFQIIWGGDAFFYSEHDRVRSAIDLIRSGYEGRASTRFAGYRSEYLAIGRALPRDARLMIHTSHVNLGIDREVVLDWIGYQALISYDNVHTPRELFDYYHALGITHFLYETGRRLAGTKQEEVVWTAFITRYAESVASFSGYRLLRMPASAPAVETSYRVATLGLSGYADGIYPIAALNVDEYLPGEFKHYPAPGLPLSTHKTDLDALDADIDAVFVGTYYRVHGKLGAALSAHFGNGIPLADGEMLFLKKPN